MTQSTTTAGLMSYVDFQGLKVGYRKSGSGPAMLFLHNGGNSHCIWEKQLGHFAETNTCYAFDLPGYGVSADSSMRFTLSYYVSFLEEFISQNVSERVTLIGNCMGSAISLSYAREHPETVNRLVLFNVLTKSTASAGVLGPFVKLSAPFPWLRGTLRTTLGTVPVPGFVAKQVIAAQFGPQGPRDDALISELSRLYRKKAQVGALADILVDIDSYDSLDDFRIPPEFPETLVIWGEANQVLPLAAGEKLCRRLQPDRLERIVNGGHLVMHEFPQQVNHLVDDFQSAGEASQTKSSRRSLQRPP